MSSSESDDYSSSDSSSGEESLNAEGRLFFFGPDGKYGCFSSRSRHSFHLDGVKWPSVEHYIQAKKFEGTPLEDEIRAAKSPAKAASLANSPAGHTRRTDWDDVKLDIVYKATKAKFLQYPYIARLLVSTYPKQLLFGTPSMKRDDFWGWAGGTGENQMGKILMRVRDKLHSKGVSDSSDPSAAASDSSGSVVDPSRCVQYATSGKSCCRHCNEKIAKATLRFGRVVKNKWRKVTMWFHLDCYFKKYAVAGAGVLRSFSGFDVLNDEDQKHLLSLVPASDSSVPISPPSTIVKQHVRSACCAYATSGRASCRWCHDVIPNNALRLGLRKRSHRFDGVIVWWYHIDCFFERHDVEHIDGIEHLRWHDQVALRARMRGASASEKPAAMDVDEVDTKVAESTKRGKKRKHDDDLDDYSPMDAKQTTPSKRGKKRKRDEAELDEGDDNADVSSVASVDNVRAADEEEVLRKENELLWSVKEKLREECDIDDMRALWTSNGMDPSGQSYVALVDSAAECMLYGAVPACPECGSAKLMRSFHGNGWLCRGFRSAWSKCDFRTTDDVIDAKRGHWTIPKALKKSSKFLAEFVFTKRIRPRSSATPSPPPPRKRRRVSASRSHVVATKQKLTIKGRGAVDPLSGLCDRGHVYQDDSGTLYHVTLNLSDVTTGANSFYVLQLIEDDGEPGKLWLFRRWGRTGTDIGGKTVTEWSGSVEDAIAKFAEVFEEKTGHKWDRYIAKKECEKKPGKYVPIELDFGSDNDDNGMDEDAPVAAASPSVAMTTSRPTDHPRVRSLIEQLFDEKFMEETLVELEFDADRMPLGMLTRSQILKGYEVLNEISSLLLLSDISAEAPEFRDLSNQFYTLIPHKLHRHELVAATLNSAELVRQKTEMLDALAELERVHRLMRKPLVDDSDPVFVHYRTLKTEIVAVDPATDTAEFRFLENYVNQCQSGSTGNLGSRFRVKLRDAFRIEREGERSKFVDTFGKVDNHQLLFHGSRTTNFVGILSEGLRIAPPSAPTSGYLFGKGLYFADMIQKSAFYCRASKENPIGLVLLSEVALGMPFELTSPRYMDSPPVGTHSTVALGRVGPKKEMAVIAPSELKALSVSPARVIVPVGTAGLVNPSSSMEYNEYIVYNAGQVYQRYLLRVEFEFL